MRDLHNLLLSSSNLILRPSSSSFVSHKMPLHGSFALYGISQR